MEKQKLIPYSVHLPPDIHAKPKEAAGNRKASSLVRDAITLIIEGDEEFNGGYNKAISDLSNMLSDMEIFMRIGYDGECMADHLHKVLMEMRVPQNTKGKANGKKKG